MPAPHVSLRPATLADLDAFQQRFDSADGTGLEHTRAERIQVTTDVENAAELAAVERIGFQREGRVRRAQWRGGRWHDQLLLSLLRDEWRDLRTR